MTSIEPIVLDSDIPVSVRGRVKIRSSDERPVVQNESGVPAGLRLRIAKAFEPEPIGNLSDVNGIMGWLLRPGRPYSDLVAIDLNAISLYRGRCAADVALR